MGALTRALLGLLAVAGLVALPPAAAAAAPAGLVASSPAAAPVGGAELGGTGVVENAGPGVPALPPLRSLQASSWLVANLTTGAVLAARAPHERYRPASTLKVLTALTLIPRLNPASLVTATEADAAVGGSMVGIQPGHSYTVAQLFTAMLVVSGNDAATALADANGGVAATVAEMNAEARALQAKDTEAGTVDGLDAPGQVSSAYDLALISRAALALPQFRAYIAIRRAFMPESHGRHFEIDSHNPLLGYYPGTFGVKNGYTTEDEATYIGVARHGATTILVTLMHANPYFAPTAEALLNWGFAANATITPVGQLVGPATAPKPAAPAVRRARPVAAGVRVTHASWHGVLLDVGIALGALLVAGSALRVRARRRRYRRSRLSLPRY